MNLDLQKFFIGLMDFLSILLPGALLTWLLMDEVGPVVLGERCGQKGEKQICFGKPTGPQSFGVISYSSLY